VSGTVRFILGGIIGLLGVLGLLGAAEAGAGELYYGGLVVFAAAIAYDFNLIKAAFDAGARNRAS
jgi:hypothetical protein